MDDSIKFKSNCDDFEAEYEIIMPKASDDLSAQKELFRQGIIDADSQIAAINRQVDELNKEIDRLTSHADGVDLIVAAISGVLCGVIDAVFVEDFSLLNASKHGTDTVNKFVTRVAKMNGFKGGELSDAVKFLEKLFPIAADKCTNAFGGGLYHRLRDFSHHPTPVGLVFSMLTQFTGMVYGTDVHGVFKVEPIPKEGLIFIGKDLPQKITLGLVYWFFHMVSDMAGSSSSIGSRTGGMNGTGLPGFLVSLLKEVSALPFFKKLNQNGHKEFSVWITQLFNGTLKTKLFPDGIGVKFDLRTEIGIAELLTQQAIPVMVNECIVRGFYFIRRLVKEMQEHDVSSFDELLALDYNKFLPFKNRTVVRMLTVSTSIMTAIDLADAAIEAAIKSGGVNNPLFVRNMIVKVNFVGLGRFAIAVGTDVGMGIKRQIKLNERLSLYNQRLYYYQAKVFCKQGEMWLEAQDAEKATSEMCEALEKSIGFFTESMAEISNDLEQIGELPDSKDNPNAKIFETLADELNWG